MQWRVALFISTIQIFASLEAACLEVVNKPLFEILKTSGISNEWFFNRCTVHCSRSKLFPEKKIKSKVKKCNLKKRKKRKDSGRVKWIGVDCIYLRSLCFFNYWLFQFFFARTGKLRISEMRSRPGSWHAWCLDVYKKSQAPLRSTLRSEVKCWSFYNFVSAKKVYSVSLWTYAEC